MALTAMQRANDARVRASKKMSQLRVPARPVDVRERNINRHMAPQPGTPVVRPPGGTSGPVQAFDPNQPRSPTPQVSDEERERNSQQLLEHMGNRPRHRTVDFSRPEGFIGPWPGDPGYTPPEWPHQKPLSQQPHLIRAREQGLATIAGGGNKIGGVRKPGTMSPQNPVEMQYPHASDMSRWVYNPQQGMYTLDGIPGGPTMAPADFEARFPGMMTYLHRDSAQQAIQPAVEQLRDRLRRQQMTRIGGPIRETDATVANPGREFVDDNGAQAYPEERPTDIGGAPLDLSGIENALPPTNTPNSLAPPVAPTNTPPAPGLQMAPPPPQPPVPFRPGTAQNTPITPQNTLRSQRLGFGVEPPNSAEMLHKAFESQLPLLDRVFENKAEDLRKRTAAMGRTGSGMFANESNDLASESRIAREALLGNLAFQLSRDDAGRQFDTSVMRQQHGYRSQDREDRLAREALGDYLQRANLLSQGFSGAPYGAIQGAANTALQGAGLFGNNAGMLNNQLSQTLAAILSRSGGY